eukprot:5649046-Karenia_brevis.AAC.1
MLLPLKWSDTGFIAVWSTAIAVTYGISLSTCDAHVDSTRHAPASSVRAVHTPRSTIVSNSR